LPSAFLDHIGFGVKDLKAFIKTLEASNVKLDRPYTVNEAGIGIAFVTDPWGTIIEIKERPPPIAALPLCKDLHVGSSPSWQDGVAATNLLRYCFGEDRPAVLRLQEPVGKAQNLKTAGIADDPEIQFVPFPVSGKDFDKARQTSLFFDGSIDAP
jgi:hypothetical protein